MTLHPSCLLVQSNDKTCIRACGRWIHRKHYHANGKRFRILLHRETKSVAVTKIGKPLTPELNVQENEQLWIQIFFSEQKTSFQETFFNKLCFVCKQDWNYRGCWQQTCPPNDAGRALSFTHSNHDRHGCLAMIFLITTSMCHIRVTCAASLDVKAVSQVSSPDSNPKSRVTVAAAVGQNPTIGSET